MKRWITIFSVKICMSNSRSLYWHITKKSIGSQLDCCPGVQVPVVAKSRKAIDNHYHLLICGCDHLQLHMQHICISVSKVSKILVQLPKILLLFQEEQLYLHSLVTPPEKNCSGCLLHREVAGPMSYNHLKLALSQGSSHGIIISTSKSRSCSIILHPEEKLED
jgi:hypothetical protein